MSEILLIYPNVRKDQEVCLMRQKKTTRCLKNGQPTKTAGQQENTSTPLNFLSAEFNTIDELDDNIGNFREFESLSGITTSDMRYHEKRKQKKITGHGDAAKPEQFPAEEMLADESVDEALLSPLTIVSKGRLLIVDNNRKRAMGCAQSLQEKGMSTTVYIQSDGSDGQVLSKLESFPFIEVHSVTIDGAFGGFNPMVTGRDGRNINPSALTGQKFDYFDLVLDLQETPCYNGTQLPVGYFAPGNTEQIQAALEELPLMRGRFHKPQFTVLQEKSCLHGHSPFHTCRKCLDVCPVRAITSSKGDIVVDQYRCQGCGLCALVCPAGAVTMRSPSQEVLLSDLIGQLPVRSDSHHRISEIILYDRQIDRRRSERDAISAEDSVHVIEIEEIGRIGLETLLLLLAYGAAGVTLTCASSRPAEMQKALRGQIELAEEILRGLHLPAECIRFMVVMPYGAEDKGFLSVKIRADRPTLPDFQAPVFCLSDNRRTLIRQAVQKLGESGDEKRNIIALPAGSPFGTIIISNRCSLCMACVGSCPAHALQSCDGTPQLSLIEARCHQCGLCAAACPEEAIERIPRLLLDVEAAEKAVVLHEMEPYNCVKCGNPFASGAMISRIQEKLKGHWMYNSDRQIRRLQMCRACRTVDALTTGDYFR